MVDKDNVLVTRVGTFGPGAHPVVVMLAEHGSAVLVDHALPGTVAGSRDDRAQRQDFVFGKGHVADGAGKVAVGMHHWLGALGKRGIHVFTATGLGVNPVDVLFSALVYRTQKVDSPYRLLVAAVEHLLGAVVDVDVAQRPWGDRVIEVHPSIFDDREVAGDHEAQLLPARAGGLPIDHRSQRQQVHYRHNHSF